MSREIKDSNFASEVANGYSLVDFWAPWCGPCRQLGPIIDQISTELEGKIKVFKMNVDENQEVAGSFNIRSIPTLILFKDGKTLEIKVGAPQKSELLKWLQSHGVEGSNQ